MHRLAMTIRAIVGGIILLLAGMVLLLMLIEVGVAVRSVTGDTWALVAQGSLALTSVVMLVPIARLLLRWLADLPLTQSLRESAMLFLGIWADEGDIFRRPPRKTAKREVRAGSQQEKL